MAASVGADDEPLRLSRGPSLVLDLRHPIDACQPVDDDEDDADCEGEGEDTAQVDHQPVVDDTQHLLDAEGTRELGELEDSEDLIRVRMVGEDGGCGWG